jgi:FixJ family two-component response regulator
VIVADLKMPRMDGLQLWRHIREKDPDIPIIIVTGHGDIAMAVQAIRHGVCDFIERPYDADRLREMVTRGLHTRARPDAPPRPHPQDLSVAIRRLRRRQPARCRGNRK